MKAKRSKLDRFRPRNVNEYNLLTAQQQRNRMSALSALNEMRKSGISLSQAAKRNGASPASVLAVAGSALKKQNGKYVAAKSDKILRVLVIPTEKGPVEVGVRSAKTARIISKYDDAIKRFIVTGDHSALDRFQGVKIYVSGKWVPLLTDLDVLERLGNFGELSFESIYAVTAR
jgi:hypothetical protein